MTKTTHRASLMASSMLFGFALTATVSVPMASAQTATAQDRMTEVVVTGSRIRRAETVTTSLVTVIHSDGIVERGLISAAQALNQVTSNAVSVPQATVSGAAAGPGQQFANLFDLGVGGTLTAMFVINTAQRDERLPRIAWT